MWLFTVLALNALFGCHVWLAEAKLREGECEGQCVFILESCRKWCFFDTYGFSKSSSIIHKTDSSHPNKRNSYTENSEI